MWHKEPRNDAWREVHLAHVESLGSQLWLRCNACGHSLTPEPREFAHLHHLDMETPLLTIGVRAAARRCDDGESATWNQLSVSMRDKKRRRSQRGAPEGFSRNLGGSHPH